MNHLLEHLRHQNRLRQRAADEPKDSIWLGLSTPGMIGWTVVLCTVGGLAAGAWLDHHHPGRFSWTLTGLGLGLVLGCLQAWDWIDREQRRMFRRRRP
jgi:ATP synthase protein I